MIIHYRNARWLEIRINHTNTRSFPRFVRSVGRQLIEITTDEERDRSVWTPATESTLPVTPTFTHHVTVYGFLKVTRARVITKFRGASHEKLSWITRIRRITHLTLLKKKRSCSLFPISSLHHNTRINNTTEFQNRRKIAALTEIRI